MLSLGTSLAGPFLLGVAGGAGVRRRDRLRVLSPRASRRSDQRLELRDGRQGKALAFLRPMALQYVELTYTNQRDEILCRALSYTARHERKASRDASRYKDVKQHVYSPEETAEIDRKVLSERTDSRAADPLLRRRRRTAKRWTRSCAVRCRFGHDRLRRRLGPRSRPRGDAAPRGAAPEALHPQFRSGRRCRIYRHRPSREFFARRSACRACTTTCRSGPPGSARDYQLDGR